MVKEYKTPEQKMRFYKSKEWRSLRRKVLEEHNYECKRCKELGYVTTTNDAKIDVDHIKPIEHYPELALDKGNLQPLCVRHHNEKEGRWTKKETKWNDERW